MAPLPPRYDLTIAQGASWSQEFTVIDDAGDPLDLTTGYTARMQIREGYADEAGSSLLDLTTANTRIQLGGTAGTITLSLSDTLTAALHPTNYEARYDLELVGPSSVTRVVYGLVTVLPEVTR